MSSTHTNTFTRTHAKYLAGKVVADLYQCSLLYDRPDPSSLADYQEELTILLAGSFVESYEFGFTRNGTRLLTWSYTVGPAGDLSGDGRSGNLTRGIDVSGAEHFNFLTHSAAWSRLSRAQREAIEASLPFRRTAGSAPPDGNGYWTTELGYSAGGMLVQRKVFRPW
ncbi:MAG: hypothetical protein WD096_10390 [Actinomycetota bacterium]